MSDPFVGKLRREVLTVSTSKSTENLEHKKRTGKDGKSYSQPRPKAREERATSRARRFPRWWTRT